MWFLPTYKRPDKCREVIQSAMATGISTPGIVIVQGDQTGYDFELPEGWAYARFPKNVGLSAALDWAYTNHKHLDWYGFMTDDVFPTSEGWDLKLIEAAGSKYIAHGNDNFLSDTRLAGTVCFGGDLIRALGRWAVPNTWHCYNDDLWESIVDQFRVKKYLPDVTCRSPHPMNNGSAKADQTYEAAYAPFEADGKAYEAWLKSDERKKAWWRLSKLTGVELVAKKSVSLKGKRIAIASPCYDGKFVQEYLVSLLTTIREFDRHGVDYAVYTLQKCSILEQARNRLLAEFLQTDCTHFMFIDADMGWPENSVLELMAHDKPVIAAVGVTKEKRPKFCVRLDKSNLAYDRARGLIRAHEVGAAFLLLRRDAVEKAFAARAHLAYTEPDAPDLKIAPVFKIEYEGGKAKGEDYGFCKLWRELGGEIWIDPSIRLDHVGMFAYSGTYAELLAEKAEVKAAHAREDAAA